MKVIFYQEQKKITVNNVAIADMNNLAKMLHNSKLSEMDLKDLQLYNFRITSTRGMMQDDIYIEDEELEKEIEEGINCHSETVH